LLAEPASPFVAAFVGEATRLDCSVRDGVVHFEAPSLAPLRAALPDGPALAFVQAHDIVAEAGPGEARVRVVRQTADGRRLLVVQAGDVMLDATGSAGAAMTPGDACRLTLRGGHLFAADGNRVLIAS
jgi:sulfate transport system ATP-binding protein